MTARDPLAILETAYSFGLDEPGWLTQLAEQLSAFDLGGGLALYVSDLGDEIRIRNAVCATDRLGENDLREVVSKIPPKIYRRAHAPSQIRYSGDFAQSPLARSLSFPVPVGWGINAGDTNLETMTMVFYCDPGAVLSEKDQATLDCIGAHLGSALRLRSLLATPPSSDHHDVEAVLSADGTVLDARGDAVVERPSLIDAVKRSERARLRGAAPEERLELWTALIEGRWSILEHVERDGKRVLLACKNEPRVAAIRALTRREIAVARYATLGHPLKYMAYELGISIATAAADLDRALKKLGLASRADLIQIFEQG